MKKRVAEKNMKNFPSDSSIAIYLTKYNPRCRMGTCLGDSMSPSWLSLGVLEGG